MLWNPFINLEVNPDDLIYSELCSDAPDERQAVQEYCYRQELLRDVFKGEMHPDDYLDCLMAQGISPDAYLKLVDPILWELT